MTPFAHEITFTYTSAEKRSQPTSHQRWIFNNGVHEIEHQWSRVWRSARSRADKRVDTSLSELRRVHRRDNIFQVRAFFREYGQFDDGRKAIWTRAPRIAVAAWVIPG